MHTFTEDASLSREEFHLPGTMNEKELQYCVRRPSISSMIETVVMRQRAV